MRATLSIMLVLGFLHLSFAECHAPRYEVGSDFSNSQLGVGSLYVGLDVKNFTLPNLICLGQAIRKKHEKWSRFSILFFTSQEAAKSFVPPGGEGSPSSTKAARQLHAIYTFNAGKHEQYLDILPFGFETSKSYYTRIELPPVAIPHCHLELGNRCLIALAPIAYPRQALKVRAEGTITLTGTITAGGRIGEIRVEKNDVLPEANQQILADQATQNLATWQLEPAQHQDAMKIVYSFKIDPSGTGVQFELPTKILIRGDPSSNR
jgi:Gram-negative bacterial TonB protein C-terminal